MGFQVTASEEALQEREIRGQYHKVEVACWFTASGKMMPQMVKYMDEDGSVQTLTNISVKDREQKHYAGILSQKFKCNVVVDGREWEFILLYNPKEGLWDMVI